MKIQSAFDGNENHKEREFEQNVFWPTKSDSKQEKEKIKIYQLKDPI